MPLLPSGNGTQRNLMLQKTISSRCLFIIAALMLLTVSLPALAEPFNTSHLSFALNDEGTGYIVSGYYEGVPKPSGTVTIPSEYKGLPVVKIADLAFSSWDRFTTLKVPASVKEIGSKAFQYCSKVSTITIEEGSALTTIGEMAFYKCKSVSELSLPGTVTSIGQLAFGSTGLVTVTLGEGIPEIPASAFNASTNLRNINFPASCTKIGKYAFCNCAFETLEIPSTIETIEEGAFAGCGYLTALDINVPTIGLKAFEACTMMQTLKIGKGVTSIGDLAFAQCGSLASIEVDAGNGTYDSRESCNALVHTASNTLLTGSKNTVIPASVTAIADYGFSRCAFTTFTVPNTVATIGAYAFSDCDALESIELPAGLRRIEESTFRNCYALASIAIPEGVTSIGKDSFCSCSALTTITLPAGIEEYGADAFYSTGLTSLTSLRPTAVAADTELFGPTGCSVYTDATLNVPFGSGVSYRITTPWRQFCNLKEGIGNRVLTAPTFSAAGGFYSEDVVLTITNPNDRGKIYYYTTKSGVVKEYTGEIYLRSPFSGDVVAIVVDGDDISECTTQYYEVSTPSLGVTVAGIAVTEKNQWDVLDDKTVSYDSKSGILYLNNANICDKEAYTGIEVEGGDLTMMISGDNSISACNIGIFMNVAQTQGGTLTISGKGETDVLTVGTTDNWGEDIYVYLSNLRIENCKVVLKNAARGVIMKIGEGGNVGNFEIDNAKVDITVEESAMSGVYALTLGDGLTILEPEGAEFVACDGSGAFGNIKVDGVVQNHVVIGKKSTGIEGIEAAQPVADDAIIYDVQGHRLERITQPGFYIVGGKKVIVK